MTSSKKFAKRQEEKRPTYQQRAELPVLGLLVIGTFLLRVLGQLDKVFVGDNVWFRGMDAWYHMRLADNVVANFPNFLQWDMLAQYPDGAAVGYMPLLSWLAAIFGSNYETAAAYLPAALGAFTIIPVYLIGKELFSRRVGLLAGFLVAVMPGEFLHRTLLGFTDHHALEALLSTTIILLLLHSYRTLKYRYIIPTGICLGLYQLSWTGTTFFLFIIAIWTWWEFLHRLRDGKSIYPLVKVISIPTGIGLLMSISFANNATTTTTLGLLFAPVALWLLTKMTKDKEKILFSLTMAIPISLVVLGTLINWNDLLAQTFWGGNRIEEAAPLTPSTMFATYGIASFTTFAGLWFYRKGNSLFLIWTIVLIVATIGQLRWGYYTTIPVSLLTAYFAFYLTRWVNRHTRAAVVFVVILFLLLPNIQGTIRLVQLPNTITANWYVTLTWLKQNTPEPLVEGESAYYQLATERPQYGILSWWSYGHWIIRIANRVPLSSPTQSSSIPSQFFTAQSEEAANAILEHLKIKYVIVDDTLLQNMWPALLLDAGEKGYTNVQQSFLQTLWNEEALTWSKIYERGDIKVFERAER